MTKLDDIFKQTQVKKHHMMTPEELVLKERHAMVVEDLKQQIKSLMLELKAQAIKGSFSGSQALERFEELVNEL